MSSCSGSHCDHGKDQQTDSPGDDRELREKLQRIKHKILVMSGKGGVGKSSVSALLAVGLAMKGYRVGVLDVDLHGPSIPRMLGVQGMFRFDEERKCLIPQSYNERLQVVSIECLLEDRDSAVIWRGPVKHGVIKQFISEVTWEDLDYLIIDSPPGTGDEPLSVAQTITDACALIVTTPQEVALADVRKSINFCRQVGMRILGLVENMSGFVCPHCNRELALFGKGGGARTAELMTIPFLGGLPFDPRIVVSEDVGQCILETPDDSLFIQACKQLIHEVITGCSNPAGETMPREIAEKVKADHTDFKVAIPLAGGSLTNHFGHCEQFAIVDVQAGRIQAKELVVPPPHEPGLLPRWLGELDVSLIIAGGMGRRALDLFGQQNIKVITGAPNLPPEELIKQYLEGTLLTGANVCDH